MKDLNSAHSVRALLERSALVTGVPHPKKMGKVGNSKTGKLQPLVKVKKVTP